MHAVIFSIFSLYAMQITSLLSLFLSTKLSPFFRVYYCQLNTKFTMPPKRNKPQGESTKKLKESKSSEETTFGPPVQVPFNGKTFNTKIVSWNVNGIRAVLKKGATDFLKNLECDILCLQEIKCNEDTFPKEFNNDWKMFPHKYSQFSKNSGYAGVSIFSKIEPIEVEYGLKNEKLNDEGRVITAHYEKFILVNAYTPNSGRGLVRLDYRINEWDKEFREHLQQLDAKKPVILCGDLNVAHKEIDLMNPKTNTKTAGFTPQERESFSQLLEAGFIDSFRFLYPDRRNAFTFWSAMSKARERNVGWRLDYFVTSERFKAKVVDNQILCDVMGSDHCPVALYLNL